MLTAFVLSLGPLADGIAPFASAATERRFVFNFPAADAASVLSTIATTGGVAVGWPGGLPSQRLRALRGTMTIEVALRQLLEGSGYAAERVGITAYRIVRLRVLPPPLPPPPRPPVRIVLPQPARIIASRPLPPQGDIIVTGQKQPQALRDVPLSVSVVMFEEPRIGPLDPGTRAAFDSIDGVAVTNLGPGRNRQFIRGVADSPFNGPSQSTVAVQLDEARVTYDAPDPDLRLVDMQRVEVLKGPQGALYGSGALGGIYHMVTRRPDLEDASAIAHLGVQAVQHGGIGGSADATLNLPIVVDRLAVRATAYDAHEAGWIDDIGRKDDANSARVVGGRLALRWQAASRWSLDLSGAIQDVNTRDSQYVTASPDTLRRVAPVPEPTDNNFKSAAATINGVIGPVDVLAISSYVRQRVDVTLESTVVSTALGLPGRTTFTDHRSYQVRNHELRLSSSGPLRWLAGLSYLHARSELTGTGRQGPAQLLIETRYRRVREYAGFAEVSLPLPGHITGTLGTRVSRTQTAGAAALRAVGNEDRTASTQVAPSGSLSWRPSERTIVYLRYARAVRPGGLAPGGRAIGESPLTGRARTRRFDADELGSFDVGFRRGGVTDRLSLSASAFATDWRHIQTDYLLNNGLISTRNAGRARIRGAEASADWRPDDPWLLTVGVAYVDARLVRDETGRPIAHRRLPVTPDLTARARAQYGFGLGEWDAKIETQVNYVGTSRLSFDPPFDRRMGRFATIGVGAVVSRSRFAMTTRIDNLLDAKGNTFAFGNPFSIAALPQYTPQRPRTISLSVARSW